MTGGEEFVVKLNLRRLLYRMERFKSFEGSTTAEDDDEDDPHNFSSASLSVFLILYDPSCCPYQYRC